MSLAEPLGAAVDRARAGGDGILWVGIPAAEALPDLPGPWPEVSTGATDG